MATIPYSLLVHDAHEVPEELAQVDGHPIFGLDWSLVRRLPEGEHRGATLKCLSFVEVNGSVKNSPASLSKGGA